MLKEKNKHKNDDNISFDEKDHIYTIKDQEKNPISVTTLIHNFFPKFNADLVIDKIMKGKNWTTSQYYGMKKEEIKEKWEKNGIESSTLGTNMHADIERFFNNEELINKESREINYFHLFWKDFKIKFPEYEPYRVEWVVYDKSKRLAGSIDCTLSNNEGEIIILDWKRSKEIKKQNNFEKGYYPFGNFPNCNYYHYSIQLNLYRFILETNYRKKIKNMFIVVFHPNNQSYEIHQIQNINIELYFESLF